MPNCSQPVDYVTSNNMPGYMPDNAPNHHGDYADAVAGLSCDIQMLFDQYEFESEAAEAKALGQVEFAKKVLAEAEPGTEFSGVLLGRVFNLSRA